MGNSIESSRPIMAPSVASSRTSKRFSTLTASTTQHLRPGDRTMSSPASATTSSSTVSGSDPRLAELKQWTQGFDRLEQKRLQQQRYAPTAEKTDSLSKLALGAKVERALGRRMTDQDAVYRPKSVIGVVSEKRGIKTAS